MNSKIEARATHRFKASADRIYDAWLNPAQSRCGWPRHLRNRARG